MNRPLTAREVKAMFEAIDKCEDDKLEKKIMLEHKLQHDFGEKGHEFHNEHEIDICSGCHEHSEFYSEGGKWFSGCCNRAPIQITE